jgi:hypothetical protein
MPVQRGYVLLVGVAEQLDALGHAAQLGFALQPLALAL